MPAVTRELSVVYGTLTVGGTSSDHLLDGRVRLDRGYGRTVVEWDFVTVGTSEATFATLTAAAEDALRTPRQRLRILQGAVTLLDLNPSTRSGFDAAPTIAKRGDTVGDTGRSRRYTARVEVGTPADLAGQAGRLDSSVEVTYLPSRLRRLRVSGTYTATTSGAARAQYEGAIAAYVATLTTALTGTWERVDEVATANDADTALVFARTYEELLLEQASGTLDHASVVQQRLEVARRRFAPGDTAGTSRLVELDVSYAASFDKDLVTDLSAAWTGTVRPWLLQHAAAVTGLASVVVETESVRFDRVENRLGASLRLLAVGSSSVLAHAVTTTEEEDRGLVLVPVWDGGPFSRLVAQGPATRTRTTTAVTRTVRGASAGGGGGAGGAPRAGLSISDAFGSLIGGSGLTTGGSISGAFGALIGGGGSGAGGGGLIPGRGGSGSGGGSDLFIAADGAYVQVGASRSETPLRIGLADAGGALLDVVDSTVVIREVFVKPVASGGREATSSHSGGGRIETPIGRGR